MPRNAPALPSQALPPDKRPPPRPDAFTRTLPSGLDVQWRMPDPFTMIAFDGIIPDPLIGAVIDLLKAEKSFTAADDPMRYRHESTNIRGMYGLAAAMLEKPKLDPMREYGDGNGTLGRREIGYRDVLELYWLFQLGTRTTPIPAADPVRSDGPADAALAGDGVRADASAAVGA